MYNLLPGSAQSLNKEEEKQRKKEPKKEEPKKGTQKRIDKKKEEDRLTELLIISRNISRSNRLPYDMISESQSLESSQNCSLKSKDFDDVKSERGTFSGPVDVNKDIDLKIAERKTHKSDDFIPLIKYDDEQYPPKSNPLKRLSSKRRNPPKLVSQSVQTDDTFPLLCDQCSSHTNSPIFTPPTTPGALLSAPQKTRPPIDRPSSKQYRADFVLVNRTNNVTHYDSYFREHFEENLLNSGLDVHKILSSDGSKMYTVVGCKWETLGLTAEGCRSSCDLNITKRRRPIDNEEEESCFSRFCSFFETDQEVDFISAPFRWDKRELFSGIEDPDTFFRSSLRSFLTHHILIRTDVSKKRDTSDGINIRGLNYLKLKGVYSDVFILHDRPSTLHRRKAFKEENEDQLVVDPRQELWDSWKIWYKFQPLWKIRNYFGEKIAFYFAWIELYSSTLIWPTLFGIVVFLYGLRYRSIKIDADSIIEKGVTSTLYDVFTVFNNPITPWFSLALCLWGTIFVEQWKRQSNSLKYEWDVSNFEQLEPDRPQFYGSATRKNPITDEEEWYYPFHRLYMKISVSVITLCFMVFLVIASTMGVIIFRVASVSSNLLVSDAEQNALYTSVVSSVINAAAIMILGFLYEKIAYTLTNWENHRTQTDYDDSLIIKLFAFQFVNNYASLIYIAFFKQSVSKNGMFGHDSWTDPCYEDDEGNDQCYPMLVLQVAVLLIMKPMPKFFKDVCVPILLHLWQRFRKRGGPKDNVEAVNAGPEPTKELIDIIEEDRNLMAGDTDFTLSEYTEKSIMYGIIMLFGAVFPLAPLIALITNMIDVRVDGYRILWKNRRYIAQRAEDIGIWQFILEFLNNIGIVINSLIIAHTLQNNGSILDETQLDDGSASLTANRWLVAFAFEHVCFLVKFVVSYIIPDVPSDVQFKMRKEQFQVNQLFEKSPAQRDAAKQNPSV